MIKFFRHIRQASLGTSKISRYLLYAIGEIILVVIGILIALQVNNWNQDRIENNETKALLTNLKLDVEEHIQNLKSHQKSLKNRKEWADLILQSIASQEVDDSIKFISAMSRVGWILDYSSFFPTYKEIVSSGKLSYIKSDSLKKTLANYESQFEENSKITSSYNLSLKEAEKLALGHLNGMPATSSSSVTLASSNNVSFDLADIAKDFEFYLLVKQIFFQTAVTIDYISVQLIIKTEQIEELIKEELEMY